MSGLIGKLITNGTVQRLGQVPAGTYAVAHLTAINTNTSADPADVTANRTFDAWAAAEGTSPSTIDLIEHAVIEKNYGHLDHSCRILQPGEVIWVKADPGVVVRMDYVNDEA